MSSPVQTQGDSGMLRKAYFDWQISRNPSERRAIEGAFKKAEEELYHLKDIHGFKKPDWLDLKVPLGLGRRLSSEVKEFLIQERVAAAQRGQSRLESLAAAATELAGQLSD